MFFLKTKYSNLCSSRILQNIEKQAVYMGGSIGLMNIFPSDGGVVEKTIITRNK